MMDIKHRNMSLLAKKLFCTFLCSVLFTINYAQKNATYEITGKFAGLIDGSKIMINSPSDLSGFRLSKFDSCTVKNGQFHFSGILRGGVRLFFISGFANVKFLSIIVGPNEKINLTGGDISKAPSQNIREYISIDGNYTDRERSSFATTESYILDEAHKIDQYFSDLNSQNKVISAQAFDSIAGIRTQTYRKLYVDAIKQLNRDTNNLIIPLLAIQLFFRVGKEEFLPEIFSKLSKEAKESYYGELMSGIIKSCKGQVAPDFDIIDSKNIKTTLHDLIPKSKLTLVYFWSLDPTRPRPREKMLFELLPLYNKYRSEGFNLIGVYIGKDSAKWKATLNSEVSLPWYQAHDFSVDDNDGITNGIAKTYGYISSVWPFNILIDEKGKIIDWQVEKCVLPYYLHKTFKN